MSREIRSHRAVPLRPRPLYARVLGLQYVVPSGPLCFLFLAGTIALGVLLALTELVTWWAVPVLPAVVAAMVKLNDIIAGALAGPAGSARPARTARSKSAATDRRARSRHRDNQGPVTR